MMDMHAKVLVGLNDKHFILISKFNQIRKLSKQFSRFSNTKFYENPFGGLRVVARGQTQRQIWGNYVCISANFYCEHENHHSKAKPIRVDKNVAETRHKA
jgi:hypothetical protein